MKQAKSKVTLSIKTFKIKTQLADESACGGWDKCFKASMDVTVEDLDHEGFVIENLTLIDEVKTRFKHHKYKASCEELALGIIHVLHSLAPKRLLRAEVKVFNLTGHLEAIWVRGDAVPQFPRTV